MPAIVKPSSKPTMSSECNINPKNNKTMFQIFQNVQFNVVQHKKYVKEMKKLYKQIDQEEFFESFKNALYYLFTFGDSSANVDRVIQFVATFCTLLEDQDDFLLFIFNIIFDCQCVSGQSVRFRASQLLAVVLSSLGNDASLDDALCDKLLISQMDRLNDTRGAVRCRAALALERLQNPSDPNDAVTKAYLFHMSCDPSASVRRAIIHTIAKANRNVPYVLQRLSDVDEAVRRAAFHYITSFNVSHLKVKQRLLALKVGLTERVPRVRKVVETMLIPAWLGSFKGNIIDLLKAIRLDTAQHAKDSQYVAGKLLEILFKQLPISELLEWLPLDQKTRTIHPDKLCKETAWYWRHLAQHLQTIDDDETLEIIIPDLVVFTEYIKSIVSAEWPCPSAQPAEHSTRQHVLHELACMLGVYDACDPAGRAALLALITDTLTGEYGPLSEEVIRALVRALETVVPEVSQRIEAIGGVIGALRDPPPDPADPASPAPPLPDPVDRARLVFERTQVRVSLNVAIEAQEEAVRAQNYALAAECKAEVERLQEKLKQLDDINHKQQVHASQQQSVETTDGQQPNAAKNARERKCDADTLNKCLHILNCALDTMQLKSITPMLRMIFEDLKLDIYQNPEVLNNALVTLTLYGMLDKEFAKENKSFFYANLMDIANEQIMLTTLRCIGELLCVHGPTLFEEDSKGEEVNNSEPDDDDDDDDEDFLDYRKNRSRRKRKSALHQKDGLSQSLPKSQGHTTVIEVMLSLVDTAHAGYRLVVVENLCRLLYLGHLESPSILSRLLLLWFSPATAEEDMLRQTIGVFFQVFPARAENAQEQIQKAAMPTLRALVNAPSSSPLSEVDHEAVVRFIVSLAKVNSEFCDSEGCLGATVCEQLARAPGAPEAGLACRALALLAPPRDSVLAASLIPLLRSLATKLPDKQSCRNLIRYLGSLEAMERKSITQTSTGMTETTIQTEDTLMQIGRATSSLPQPIARSTHFVVKDVVLEEEEIEEMSPEATANEHRANTQEEALVPSRLSFGSDTKKNTKRKVEDAKDSVSDSSTETFQKGRTNGRKKKLATKNITTRKVTKVKTKNQNKKAPETSEECEIDHDEIEAENKSPMRVSDSSSSADETKLHTIVYDNDMVQSLLESSEADETGLRVSRANVTVPETPENSDQGSDVES